MEHVLTLVGNPLTPALAGAVADRLPRRPAPAWLDAGIACDLALADMPVEAAEAAAREALDGAPVDLLAQPAAGRRKRLLVADMDSTIITVECIDELADFAGVKPEIAAITERAMRGEIDFADALRERGSKLAGLTVGDMERCHAERVRLTAGAATLVGTVRRHGGYAALVSGGFTFFTGRVRAAAGFDMDVANELEVADGRLTGRVREPIRGAEAKLDVLRELTGRLGLPPEATLAIGDGANDLRMIREAGLGVAYHAKPIVAAAARAAVRHGDLTTVLYFQGYRRDEFAA